MDYKKKDKDRSAEKHHSSSSRNADRKKVAGKLEEDKDYSSRSEKQSSHASTSASSKERSHSPLSPKKRHARSPSPTPTSHKKKRRRSRSRSPSNKHSRTYGSAGYSKHSTGDRTSGRRAREARYDMIQQSLKQQEEQAKLGVVASNSNYLAKSNQPPSTNSTATKLVEEIEKRKSLFSKKAQEPTGSVWNSTSLTNDSDGKMTAKFKRLMGIKGADAPEADSTEKPEGSNRNQEEYLANLEKQYEVARAITHTQRGVGLGFGGAGVSNTRP